jgi:CheY-like chemotaxis protein/predicted Ser/Thr protein kinase
MAPPQLHILVVEDNPGDARLLLEHLREARADDVHPEQVDTLAAALARLQAGPVDLVLLDLTLPDARGLRTFTAVHQAVPTVPVVVLTGMEDDGLALQAVREGAQDYLVKGQVDGHRLLQAIRYAVERHRLLERHRLAGEAPAEGELVTRTQVVDEHQRNDRQIVAGYRLCRVLGEGSMATVYLAEHATRPERQVALKIMKLDSLTGHHHQALLERFFREAEVAASVKHPNIVEIIEFGMCNERHAPYIVMERVEGHTLQHLFREPQQYDLYERVHLLCQVASALAALHAQGICHRDVKPTNIMFDDRLTVKITDFGIALVPGSNLTIDLHLIGSPAYMAPEAFSSPKVTPAADLFSLGVVAYELLLGRRPFEGESIAQLAQQVQHERPREPRKLRPDFPLFLQQVLARLLKKDPAQRYPTTQQLVDDLRLYLDHRDSPPGLLIEAFRQRLLRGDWR